MRGLGIQPSLFSFSPCARYRTEKPMLFRNADLFATDLRNADLFTNDLLKDFERLTKGLNIGPVFTDHPETLRTDDTYQIFIDLPGVAPDAVELTVDNRTLTLTATREHPSGKTSDYGRSFELADDLDTDALTAKSEHGVLTISIPVVTAPEPRKITIT